MQLLPEAHMQCCLVLPGVACTNTSTDTVDIVSPYSRLIGTMSNDTRLQHLPRHASQPVLQHFRYLFNRLITIETVNLSTLMFPCIIAKRVDVYCNTTDRYAR
jgi:hypothetical protein